MIELVYSAEDFATDAAGVTTRKGATYTLRFDAVVSEKATFGATLTEHAVEGGASMSDHKIPRLRTVSLACVVSQHPLGDPPPSGSRTQTITSRIEKVGDSDLSGLTYSQEITRVQDVLRELQELSERPVMVTVKTDLDVYESMQVVGVSAPRSTKDGDSIEFGIDLQEVRIANVQTTEAPRPRQPRNRSDVELAVRAMTTATTTVGETAIARRRRLLGDAVITEDEVQL